jgi:hypothetical protein
LVAVPGAARAVPEVVEELGHERYVIFDVDSPRVDTDTTRAAVSAHPADETLLTNEDRARLTARLMTDAPLAHRRAIILGINPERLCFFDPDTGDAFGVDRCCSGEE